MLNITSHQGNANQNFNEVPSHTNQNGHHQKSTNILLEGVWRKGNPPTLLMGIQIGAVTREQYEVSLKKLKKNRVTYDPAIPLLSIYLEKALS